MHMRIKLISTFGNWLMNCTLREPLEFFSCCHEWQWIAVAGLWPSFLPSSSNAGRRRILDVNLVDHFVSAQHDGSMITWAHAANSRKKLQQALMSTSSVSTLTSCVCWVVGIMNCLFSDITKTQHTCWPRLTYKWSERLASILPFLILA